MGPPPDLEETYVQALERKCLNPHVGKYLNSFNEMTELAEDREITFYNAIIEHLIECRPCRKQLGDMAKYVLLGELFWSGHFLSGPARVERKQLREKREAASPHEKIKLTQNILEMYTREPWRSEIKKIRQFIEN